MKNKSLRKINKQNYKKEKKIKNKKTNKFLKGKTMMMKVFQKIKKRMNFSLHLKSLMIKNHIEIER
jgi:hypothetical protein